MTKEEEKKLWDVLDAISNHLVAIRTDIKNMKFNMLQINQLKQGQ